MRETKRGLLTTRSTLLKSLDNAFCEYEKKVGSAEEVKALKNLDKALTNWTQSKGNWQNSTRNAAQVNGQGLVEALRQEVEIALLDASYDRDFEFIKAKQRDHYKKNDFIARGFAFSWKTSQRRVWLEISYLRARGQVGSPDGRRRRSADPPENGGLA
jgi:hypothetical protein